MPLDDRERTRLSKTMSHALRHAPERYGLAPDAEGWVPIAALLSALRAQRPGWHDLSLADMLEIVERPGKQRFEVSQDRIRAHYGHSAAPAPAYTHQAPPAVLYHGTQMAALPIIRVQGLKPMRRRYVHFSADVETAHEVARRRAGGQVILRIDAAAAHQAGVHFYHANGLVWLAASLPPQFIAFDDIEQL